jgi:hypothetical protein
MDPVLVDFAKGVAAFLLTAATGLTAYWLWLRARHLAGPGRDRVLDAVRDEKVQLHADIDTQMAELDGRMNFVERRFVHHRERPRLPVAPHVPTPV